MESNQDSPNRPKNEKPSAPRPSRPGTRVSDKTSSEIREKTPEETIPKENKQQTEIKTPIRPTQPASFNPAPRRRANAKISTPPSPTSVADMEKNSLQTQLPPGTEPFYEALRTYVLKEFIKNNKLDVITDKNIATIDHICLEITLAIDTFKNTLNNDPTNLCRSYAGTILWTEERHEEIKKLQDAIKPHFDAINNFLNINKVQSSRNLYSSPVGRSKAAQEGTILEATPFGKILESPQICSALKQCFGKTAFSTTQGPKQYFQEINGETQELSMVNEKSDAVCFTVDVDTAVVLGIWEATSSSYAQDQAEIVNIYVPFGISTSSVVWNHELNEIRQNHDDEQIIIHTLRNPEEYHQLQAQYVEYETKYLALKSHEDMPSEIVFYAKVEKEDAKKAMDDYLNQSHNWESAPIHQSLIKIKSSKEKSVSLATIKKFVQKLRRTVSSSSDNSKNSDSPSMEDNDDSSTNLP